ncbi:Hypothetical protein POVR2_LOCUS218 [uncultured virus]|nr:Hypothetical protein POVR2_LOCUS218 [uncultured virus]
MEYIQLSVGTVLAIVFGAVFGFTYLLGQSKNIREQVIEQVMLLGARVILTNPQVAGLMLQARAWMSSGQQVQSAQLLHNDTVLSIPFELNGDKYVYLVHHSRRDARLGGPYFSIDADGKRVDLQHYPGISFVMQAEQLGCASIEVDGE